MNVKAANGLARCLKAEGVPWVATYPTSHVNNALGEEGVPIRMMGEERYAVAIADAFSRMSCGKQIGVSTVMGGLNATGEQVPLMVRRAFTQLRSGRPGPVLLLVPRDLAEYDEQAHPYAPPKGWKSGPDPDDVKQAVRTLLTARDPLLWVGEGVFYADATAELRVFAELA